MGTTNVKDIRFTYHTYIGPKPENGVLQHMNIVATDLLIDSATQHQHSRILFCKEITTGLDHFSGTTADGLYQFKFRAIRLSTSTSRLTVTGITMLPIPAKVFFAKSKLDHFNLYLDSVSVNDISFQNLRMRPDLDITKMTVSKGRFDIYPNPHGIIRKGDRKVSFPNSVLAHLKSILSVDTLDVQHINVSYTKYNKASGHAGTISFSNTNGRFLHISNQKEKVARYSVCTVRLTTYLMGKGKLELNAGFNLNDDQVRYHYSGHLGPIDLQDGNSVLMPLGLAKAQTGSVQSLDFTIKASQKIAMGKVTFLYHDMKVELLRHNAEGYSKKGLISLVANVFVLKSNNPDQDGTAPRFANVVYVRPKNVAFFESIWLTILSGIKPCAGVGKSETKPVDQPLTKKEQRQQKRAMRKSKRAAANAERKAKKTVKEQGG